LALGDTHKSFSH